MRSPSLSSSRSGSTLADELGELGQLTGDVGLDDRAQHQARVAGCVGDGVVQADVDAVTAQRREVRRSGLPDRERRVVACLVEGELGSQGVHAGGLQPLLGPRLQLAPGRLLQGSEQVGELGVRERELLEVGLDAGHEVLEPDPGHQLLEHRGALGVGDAVEVDLDRAQVDVVRGNGVRRGQLVLAVGPVLAGVGEAGPRLVELGDLDGRVVAGPLGEGLVQPEVVPPLHGDQVAEPHVRHLVQDHRGAELVEGAVLAAAGEVLVAQRHATGVLHRAHVVLRHVQLVVLAEGVAVVEGPLEEGEALLGELHELVDVEVLDQRLAAVVPERDLAELADVGVLDLVVLAGDDRGDVGRHRLGGLEVPHRRALTEVAGLRAGGVGDDLPVRGSGHVEGEGRLEVGLLEGRVDATCVRHLELRVEVDAVVDGVHEAVQALTGPAVGAVGAYDEHVVGREPGQGDPAVGVRREVDRGAVQRDLVHGRVHEVGERLGAGLGAGEPDRGGRGEGRVTGREVQVDGVRVDVQEGGAGGGLVPGQVGSRHGPHHVTEVTGADNRALPHDVFVLQPPR